MNLTIAFSIKNLILSALLTSAFSSSITLDILSPRKSSSTETEYNSAITGSIDISG